MEYVLRKMVLDSVPVIDISESNFKAYKEAQKVIISCLSIEEIYEILITNYLDLEKQILDTTTSYMVRSFIDIFDFADVRISLNNRLMNLLTSAKLYEDQLHRRVKSCVPDLEDVKSIIKSYFSREFDNHPEYRFMYALRNYAQHHGIPVHRFSSSGTRIENGADSLLEYSMEYAAQKDLLEEDKEFNKKVLSEIQDRVDLKTATRCYIECISNVHESARSLIKENVQSSRNLFEEAQNRYRQVYSETLVGLSACKVDGAKVVESVSLSLDWDDVRIKLQKRNPKLVNLRKRYVTGKVEKS